MAHEQQCCQLLAEHFGQSGDKNPLLGEKSGPF
jgi:hypothetical protein